MIDRKAERLGIFMNGVRVGRLERIKGGALEFVYDPSWLEHESAMAISRQLPLREEPFVGERVRDYFDNLLPDDRRIRERVAARAHAAGTQAFDLLAAVGRDCIGALQFYPADARPHTLSPPRGEALRDPEIAEIIRNLSINPLGISAEKDFRISLAGVQSKTALLRKNWKWMLPMGPSPTTHILKPAIGAHPGGPDLSLSVENEWLCLKLVRALGLNAASADIADFAGTRVLVVERFDREWSGKRLFRLPQEDLCQALGFGPARKYESDGGPGIKNILTLLNESDRRDEDRRSFMKAQLVFWLLAAIDGHAKNFSIFIRPGGFVMTPFYDVMSADPHLDPRSFPLQKIKLSMAVGEGRHYHVEKIHPRHWLQTAKECKFSGIEELIDETADAVPRAIEAVSEKLPGNFPKAVSGRIFGAMLRRAKILARR